MFTCISARRFASLSLVIGLALGSALAAPSSAQAKTASHIVVSAPTTHADGRSAWPILTFSTTETGFIMRDGAICDPIRHMGC